MKKVVRLTESDLVRLVKKVIKESDDKSTFEIKIEKTPDNELDSVIEDFFSNKTETEIQQYFTELNNRQPKWLRKLIRWFHKNKNNKKPLGKDDNRKYLTVAAIYLIVYQVFKEKINSIIKHGLLESNLNKRVILEQIDNSSFYSFLKGKKYKMYVFNKTSNLFEKGKTGEWSTLPEYGEIKGSLEPFNYNGGDTLYFKNVDDSPLPYRLITDGKKVYFLDPGIPKKIKDYVDSLNNPSKSYNGPFTVSEIERYL